MTITDDHAKYIAYELTRGFPPDSPERLAGAVASAQVDLNPHQVDAALFAFASPLSKGALLADEVGLGKTIEAGLVLSQRWAERRRRILVITPATLGNQWAKGLDLPPAEIRFDDAKHPGKISRVEPLMGRSGWLTRCAFSVESLEQSEDHLILAAATDEGEPLEPETAARLMT